MHFQGLVQYCTYLVREWVLGAFAAVRACKCTVVSLVVIRGLYTFVLFGAFLMKSMLKAGCLQKSSRELN